MASMPQILYHDVEFFIIHHVLMFDIIELFAKESNMMTFLTRYIVDYNT